MRLAVRTPFAGRGPARLPRTHAGRRASRLAGDGWYARTLDLPHGPGTVRLDARRPPRARADGLRAGDLRARTTCATPPPAVERVRRLLDADCDPVAVDDALRRRPGARAAGRAARPACGCPATSTATRSPSAPCSASRSPWPARRTVAGRLVAEHGEPVEPARRAGLTHLLPRRRRRWPTLDPESLPMPRARGRALVGAVPRPWPTATCALDRGADRDDVRRPPCSRCPASGRGPPTTSRCAPSATPTSSCPTDLGVRNALRRLGHDPRRGVELAGRLAPLALLRPDAPLEHPDPRHPCTTEETLTCGP